MNFNIYTKNFIIMMLAIFVGIFALACGGGAEEPEDVGSDSAAASSAKSDADAYAASKKTATTKPKAETPSFETGSLTQTLEIISPPTAIDVLEGKAQFRTPGSEEWVDVIDAQPIEPGWSVRTLAVSRAVLKFVDGSQLAIKPSTQVTIDKFDIVNGGPAQGGQRHARIALDNGDVDFNVIKAESPPNTWVFLTVDGAITIQGTEGSVGRRVNVKQEELSTEDKAKLIINKRNAELKKNGGEPLTTDQEAALTIEVKRSEEGEVTDAELEFIEEFIETGDDVADLNLEDLEILEQEDKLEIQTDFKIELLEGTATMVKMGQEAPKPVTPTDADDITGGTGSAPGDVGGPPIGWVPTDGPFIPVGDKGESSLDAAVVKPGVAYEKAEVKDVMPPQAPPEGAEGAAAAIPDMDGDGEFGPSDIVMMKDIALISGLGVDVGDVVPNPEGLIAAVEEAGVADINTTIELAALAGPEAVEAIVEGGDLQSAVDVAEELFSENAVVLNDAIAGAEGASTDIFKEFDPEIKTLTEDQADPAILEELIASGEIDIDVEPLVMAADIDAVSGERLDLEALRELRKAEFEPPRSEPLFDEDGVQIGVKQPDQVVFDATGNPIGKKPGDMVAVDESGAIDKEASVPDVFYLKDKAGDDKLHATTFFNAFLPKVPTGSEIGGAGEQALNMVTFDPDGNIVPTIIQYDPLGNPVGTLPFSDDFVDPSGAALTPPDLPIFDYNADGSIATQIEMPMIVKDAAGGMREFSVPPPIVFDENGDPLGMSEPPKLMMGDAGVSGFEAGRVLSKDFFSEQATLIKDSFAAMPMEGPGAGGGSGVGGFGAPLGFIPSGAMDKIAQYAAPGVGMGGPGGPGGPGGGPGGAPTTAMYDFDKYDLSGDTASFFDAGGTQRTGDEFRMQEIYRDSATGEVAGFQPITEVMCITQDCFRDASQSDAVLAKIEEKVEVLSFDEDGRAVIAEIGGQTLFTADGHLAGFIPPPIVMGGPMGGPMGGAMGGAMGGPGAAVSFAQNDMMFFSSMEMGPPMGGPGGPGMPGPMAPGGGGSGAMGPGGFGLDFSADMGEMTFMTRAAKNEEFGAAYNPMMGAPMAPNMDPFADPFADPFGDPFGMSTGPGPMPAGPSMEFSLDLNAMFGPAMPPMPGEMGPNGPPGMDDYYDPSAGMTGFAIENDFTGMDAMFAIAGPEFGGYAPMGASGPGPNLGPNTAPPPPGGDFFGPMVNASFGSANDIYATEIGAENIGGNFFEDLNNFEDARAMNEATAFANKSFEVQGAYNEALGIERDIFVAPPMMGFPGPMAPGGGGSGAMGPGAMAPMTGPMTAPMEAPMAMDAFSFADPFADMNMGPAAGGAMGPGGMPGAAFGGGGMFDNLIDAASTDITDRGIDFGPQNFEFDPDNAAAGMTMAPMPGPMAGGAPGATPPMPAGPPETMTGSQPNPVNPMTGELLPGVKLDDSGNAIPETIPGFDPNAGGAPGSAAGGGMPGMMGPNDPMAGGAPGSAAASGMPGPMAPGGGGSGAMGPGSMGAPAGTIDPATGMPSGDIAVPGEPLYPGESAEAMAAREAAAGPMAGGAPGSAAGGGIPGGAPAPDMGGGGAPAPDMGGGGAPAPDMAPPPSAPAPDMAPPPSAPAPAPAPAPVYEAPPPAPAPVYEAPPPPMDMAPPPPGPY